MDLTKEYVEMCRMARKIQKVGLWSNIYSCPYYDEKAFFYCMEHGGIREMIGGNYRCSQFAGNVCLNKNNLVWLPRQDELQGLYLKNLKTKADKLWAMVVNFRSFAEDHRQRKFKSMEQLWLAFVMKEKFDKFWDGKDWVKK